MSGGTSRVLRLGGAVAGACALAFGAHSPEAGASTAHHHHHRHHRGHAAQVAPQHNPKGHFLGVVPVNAHPGAKTTTNTSAIPLTYHNGPVMVTNRTHVIFWEPKGHYLPQGYQQQLIAYLRGVAGQSGKNFNVYSTDPEYYQVVSGTTTYIKYDSTYAGAIRDKDAFPANGCSNYSYGFYGEYTTTNCLTDAQLQAEVSKIVAAKGLPKGLNDLYFLYTPPGVGSCFDASESACYGTYYCAYHSSISAASTSNDILYANMPWADVEGCQLDDSVNGNIYSYPNGNSADPAISVTSHEHNEAITDPLGTAWFDASGNEDGDKCAYNYGTVHDNGIGQYNQSIYGGEYLLQKEWSNSHAGCVLRD